MWLKQLKYFCLFIISCLTLTACEVVELDAAGKPIIPMSEEEAAAVRNMEPKDIAEKLWANVVQDAKTNAVAENELSTKAPNKSYFVMFNGKIERIDGESGVVNLILKTATQEIPVQIGTIVRGNSIRDASSLFSFDQFKNQIQFARLSKELNRKAVASVTKIDQSAVGKTTEILTALSFKDGQLQDIVPLEITLSE